MQTAPNKAEAEISECMEIFRRLSPEGKKAAIAIAKWLVEGDPHKDDPYPQVPSHRSSG